MAKRRRRMVPAAESAEIWDRWQRGEGLRLRNRDGESPRSGSPPLDGPCRRPRYGRSSGH